MNQLRVSARAGVSTFWISRPRRRTVCSEYRDTVKADLIHIEEICRRSSSPIVPTSEQEIRKALKIFKNNKAADSFGLMSEHLTYCADGIVSYVVDLVNNIFSLRCVPDRLKAF